MSDMKPDRDIDITWGRDISSSIILSPLKFHYVWDTLLGIWGSYSVIASLIIDYKVDIKLYLFN